MDSRPLKQVDILRHELKALRYMLDNYHAGKLTAAAMLSRDDLQAEQSRSIFDSIVAAPDRSAAEQRLAELELESVDLESFLRLSGEHYYTYPQLVRERAEAIRDGRLKVETA